MRKPAVLLLHGICSNGKVFGPSVGPGLARLLAGEFNVFVGWLRGVRAPGVTIGTDFDMVPVCTSEIASGKKGAGFDFDTHLHEDLPAIWKTCVQMAGEPPLVIGYSMGGMLALAAQARGFISTRALMVIGSPVIFPGVPFYPALMRKAHKVAKILGLKRIPIRLCARLLTWYFLYFLRESRGKNLQIFRSLSRKAGVDITVETLVQALYWVESGVFCDRTGEKNYLDSLKDITIPLLFLAGERDRIAPPEAVLVGCRAVASRIRHYLSIPGATHLDLVAGDCLRDTARIARSWLSSHV